MIELMYQTKNEIPEKEGHKISRYEKEARCIFDEFNFFTTGFRVLFLIHRNKEGGATNNTKVEKIITNSPKEFSEALYELVQRCEESPLPLRIYSSANERNFEKAIRQFKFEQLEADYYDSESRERFYKDTGNRFIGCLMSPSARKTNYFLLDIDGDQGAVGEVLQLLPESVRIIKQYASKNGWHIVTEPFNPNLLTHPALEIHKDGMLLLKYGKGDKETK